MNDLEEIWRRIKATDPLPEDRATLEDRALDAAARETRKHGKTMLPNVVGYVKRNHTNYKDLALEIGAAALVDKMDGGDDAGNNKEAARRLEAKAEALARRLIRDAYGEDG
jgi:hypothetical protein